MEPNFDKELQVPKGYFVTISPDSPKVICTKLSKKKEKQHPQWIKKRLLEIAKEDGNEKLKELAINVLNVYRIYFKISEYIGQDNLNKVKTPKIKKNKVKFGNKKVPLNSIVDEVEDIIHDDYGISEQKLPENQVAEIINVDLNESKKGGIISKFFSKGTFNALSVLAGLFVIVWSNANPENYSKFYQTKLLDFEKYPISGHRSFKPNTTFDINDILALDMTVNDIFETNLFKNSSLVFLARTLLEIDHKIDFKDIVVDSASQKRFKDIYDEWWTTHRDELSEIYDNTRRENEQLYLRKRIEPPMIKDPGPPAIDKYLDFKEFPKTGHRVLKANKKFGLYDIINLDSSSDDLYKTDLFKNSTLSFLLKSFKKIRKNLDDVDVDRDVAYKFRYIVDKWRLDNRWPIIELKDKERDAKKYKKPNITDYPDIQDMKLNITDYPDIQDIKQQDLFQDDNFEDNSIDSDLDLEYDDNYVEKIGNIEHTYNFDELIEADDMLDIINKTSSHVPVTVSKIKEAFIKQYPLSHHYKKFESAYNRSINTGLLDIINQQDDIDDNDELIEQDDLEDEITEEDYDDEEISNNDFSEVDFVEIVDGVEIPYNFNELLEADNMLDLIKDNTSDIAVTVYKIKEAFREQYPYPLSPSMQKFETAFINAIEFDKNK